MAEGDTTVMTNGILGLMEGQIDLDTGGDTIKTALYSTGQFSVDDTVGYVATSEVSASGYTAGGETLAGQSVADDAANNRIEFDGTDETWSSLGSHEIQQALVYDDTVAVDATMSDVGLVMVSISTDSNGGNYTISWSSDGIFAIGHG